MEEKPATAAKEASPWPFFLLAFVLSRLFWVPAAILSQADPSFPLGLLSPLGGFGP